MTAAAFFDLDRTLMAGSSAIQWGKSAYAAGMVSRRQLAAWLYEGLRFRLHGATDDDTQRALDGATSMLEGVEAKTVARLAPDVLAGILPRIHPQMLDIVREHQDKGRRTYIVSASSHEVVDQLAQILLMDGGIGTRYEIVDGRFTGRIEGTFCYGPGKVVHMEEVAATDGVDLSESWGYSDAASDLPMLRAVKHAVAVNPDAELAEIADGEGWETIHFDRLGRRLTIAATTAVAAAIGGSGTLLALRSRAQRTPPLLERIR